MEKYDDYRSKRNNQQPAWRETLHLRELQQRRYLVEFARIHYEWLIKVGQEWKKRGEFPIDRFSLMDYYHEPNDIEVAGYVSLLTTTNEKLFDQIIDLRDLLGDHPWQWMKERGFIVLADPETASQRIMGCRRTYADLFNLLDYVWGFYFNHGEPRTTLSDIVPIQDEAYAMKMLKMRLYRKGGLGLGVRPDDGEELACPLTIPMLQLIRTFYPIAGQMGFALTVDNADDVLQFMGFDDPTEFLYTYQGYQRMLEVQPKAMERNEKYFNRRYQQGWQMEEHRHFSDLMREILPEIRFE